VAGMKSADVLDLITALPLMAAERPQSDIGRPFRLSSEFVPAGDQPQAIDELCDGLKRNERDQVLLGVTGSAHVIARTGRPAIILAPNKTLAAQLYGEMKSFFSENAPNILSPITSITSPRPVTVLFLKVFVQGSQARERARRVRFQARQVGPDGVPNQSEVDPVVGVAQAVAHSADGG
jgi:hypothetical protein